MSKVTPSGHLAPQMLMKCSGQYSQASCLAEYNILRHVAVFEALLWVGQGLGS